MKIWHEKRSPREIIASAFNAGGRMVWERKELPTAGAMQYAYETYGTPIYDFSIGNGATFVRRPLRETAPALWAHFTAPVLSNPPSNNFQGQFATQPLVDPNTAQALALTAPGAIPDGAYNVIPSGGVALAP